MTFRAAFPSRCDNAEKLFHFRHSLSTHFCAIGRSAFFGTWNTSLAAQSSMERWRMVPASIQHDLAAVRGRNSRFASLQAWTCRHVDQKLGTLELCMDIAAIGALARPTVNVTARAGAHSTRGRPQPCPLPLANANSSSLRVALKSHVSSGSG